MVILRQLKKRNQLTLPSAILKRIGIREGDYVAIEDRDGRIILNPREVEERGLDEAEWERLDRLVKEQRAKKQYKQFADFDGAIKSLKIKKKR